MNVTCKYVKYICRLLPPSCQEGKNEVLIVKGSFSNKSDAAEIHGPQLDDWTEVRNLSLFFNGSVLH